MKDESLPSILPWRGFFPDGAVDLRGNGVMVGYNLTGPSPESSTLADIASCSRQLADALLHLGTGDMVQVLYHRLPAIEPPERHFACRAAALVDAERRAQFAAENHWITLTRLYLTHQFENPLKSWLRAAMLASNGPQRQARNDLLREYALSRFSAFEDAAASAVSLSRLSPLETFRDLIMTVTCHDTYHEFPAAMPEPHVRLNEVIGCEHFIGGQEPYINGFHLRPLCITGYPAQTVPQILAVLLRHRGRMTVSARFICLDPYDARQQLELEKKHWNREILGTVWNTVKGWFGRNVKADHDTTEQLADINAAIAASAAGMTFGWATIVAAVRDDDPERADLRRRDLQRDCHALGIMAHLEDMNATEAIEGTWPANGTSNIRRPLITGANFADLVLPADHWPGLPYVDCEFYPRQTPTPLICGGAGSKTPFYYPTHIDGVGNQLIIGPVGTGKSSLIGTMITAYAAIPSARIVCLDVDHSSFVLAHLMQGDYRDIGSPDTPPLNPMAFLDLPGGLPFLYGWFERLFKRWKDFELSERAFEDFSLALRTAQREGVRSLAGLRALIHSDGPDERGKIRRILQQYIEAWGHIFNAEGAPPNETIPLLTVFEMRGLMSYDKRVSAPATELVLQSVLCRLNGEPCWIFIDEAWALLSDPTSADWFFDAIRSGRKRNASYVLATQSLTEIVNHPYRGLLLESCPGKVFLPNPEARGQHVAQMYLELGLNEHDIAIISGASSRREYYFRSAIGSRLFALALGDLAKAICSATGYKDVERARQIIAESPNGHFLDAWLSERLPDWEYRLPVADSTEAAARR